MFRKAIVPAILMFGLTVGVAHADSFGTLYDDATEHSTKGNAYLEDSHTQYLLGNRPESCEALERARVHFEAGYRDVEAIRALVESDGDLEGHSASEVMDWVTTQEQLAGQLGEQMQGYWQEHCQ